MFTGIVTHVGKFERKESQRFFFSAPSAFLKSLHPSDSVAVNGTCLTVEKVSKKEFSVSLMSETLGRTMFAGIAPGDVVNLEMPSTPSTFLAGHIVQGHIDGVGKLLKCEQKGNSRILEISIDRKLTKYIVSKGSIAVNGISLTVIESKKESFTIGIIPYTWEHTMLHEIKIGDALNIEVDILAKYVEKISQR